MQYLSFKASLLKFRSKPNESGQKYQVSSKLHAVLPCIYLVMQSYLKHLPLSGGHVYPKALFTFTDMCQGLAHSAKSLGLVKECQCVLEDSRRLVSAAQAFKCKFEEVAQPKNGTLNKNVLKTKKPSKAIRKVTPSTTEIIQKLASEKLGPPMGQTESKVSKAKQCSEEVAAPVATDIVTSNRSSEHANSSLIDGESLANDHFTNNSVREQLQIFNNLPSIVKDEKDDPPIANKASEKVSSNESEQAYKHFMANNKTLKALEIDEDELEEIEEMRHHTKMHDLKSMPPVIAHLHPLELVSSIADRVVMNIVKNVCHETVDPHLIEKLIQAELVIK